MLIDIYDKNNERITIGLIECRLLIQQNFIYKDEITYPQVQFIPS
jgi:hypothetical protein